MSVLTQVPRKLPLFASDDGTGGCGGAPPGAAALSPEVLQAHADCGAKDGVLAALWPRGTFRHRSLVGRWRPWAAGRSPLSGRAPVLPLRPRRAPAAPPRDPPLALQAQEGLINRVCTYSWSVCRVGGERGGEVT